MTNDQLMKAMGSKNGSDPIPPLQYLAILNPSIRLSETAHRLLAKVRSKTIRYGHRSPYCTFDGKKPMSMADIAREMKWDQSNAARAWKELEAAGFVKRQDKLLCLIGDIQAGIEAEAEPEVADEASAEVEPALSAEHRAIYQTWTPERRAEFSRDFAAGQDFRKRVIAEAAARARAATDAVIGGIFDSYGLTRKSLPARRAADPVLTVEIRDVPAELSRFVQTSHEPESADFVQTSKSTLYRPVFPAVSILTTEITEKEGNPPPPPSLDAVENSEHGRRRITPIRHSQNAPSVLESMQSRFPSADAGTESRLIAACQETFEQIREPKTALSNALIIAAIDRASNEAPNQKGPGLYLRNVPPIIREWAKNGVTEKRPAVAETKPGFVERAEAAARRKYGI